MIATRETLLLSMKHASRGDLLDYVEDNSA